MVKKISFVALLALATVAPLGAHAQGVRGRQEAACTGDALRLCGDYIPDEGRITACMNTKRSQLSTPCRAFFDK
jgi:hypothetical protein